MSQPCPGRRDCRAAARRIRAAQHGRQADLWARPRSAVGLYRSRPPLFLVLYLAARSGLLVWRPRPDGPDLVLLSPPEPFPGGSAGPGTARRPVLDRWWEPLVFAAVAVGALGGAALAAVVALAVPVPGPVRRTLALLALLLIVLAVAWAAVALVVVTVRGVYLLLRYVERPPEDLDELAAESVRAEWNVALLHAGSPSDVAELLRETGRLAGGTGTGLVCPEPAITTSAAREEVRRLGRVSHLPGRPPTVVTTVGSARAVRRRRSVTGTGLSLFLLTNAVVVAMEAKWVADAERAACAAADCSGRPTSYGQALSWLLGRMVLVGPDDGLTVATTQAAVTGWLSLLNGIVVAAGVVLAVRRAMSAHRSWNDRTDGQPLGGTRVFLNYRGLHDGWAVTLDRSLSDRFGPENVFQASRSIEPGEDFTDRLLAAVRSVDVLVAVIGPGWLDATGPDGTRRLDDPEDWVRREIVEALAHQVQVVPVVVDGARLPAEAELPDALAPLARRQYRRLARRTVDADLPEILDAVATASARR